MRIGEFIDLLFVCLFFLYKVFEEWCKVFCVFFGVVFLVVVVVDVGDVKMSFVIFGLFEVVKEGLGEVVMDIDIIKGGSCSYGFDIVVVVLEMEVVLEDLFYGYVVFFLMLVLFLVI